MRVSARNQLQGTVKSVTDGAVNSEVTIEVAPGVIVTAQVTSSSVARLGLMYLSAFRFCAPAAPRCGPAATRNSDRCGA
jgi:molybdate transport system regulatory protein